MIKIKNITAIILLAAVSGMAAEMDGFINHWQVDYEATLASIKTSPKYDPEKDARILPNILKRIAAAMILEISDKTVTFKMNQTGASMHYTVQSEKPGKVVLTGKINDVDVTLTLTKRKKGRISLKSSLTDDMDYYIWKPAEKEKSERVE